MLFLFFLNFKSAFGKTYFSSGIILLLGVIDIVFRHPCLGSSCYMTVIEQADLPHLFISGLIPGIHRDPTTSQRPPDRLPISWWMGDLRSRCPILLVSLDGWRETPPPPLPGEHDTLIQCWVDVGPALQTVDYYWIIKVTHYCPYYKNVKT